MAALPSLSAVLSPLQNLQVEPSAAVVEVGSGMHPRVGCIVQWIWYYISTIIEITSAPTMHNPIPTAPPRPKRNSAITAPAPAARPAARTTKPSPLKKRPARLPPRSTGPSTGTRTPFCRRSIATPMCRWKSASWQRVGRCGWKSRHSQRHRAASMSASTLGRGWMRRARGWPWQATESDQAAAGGYGASIGERNLRKWCAPRCR